MYKKFLVIYGSLILLLLGGTVAVTLCHDPLFQYSDPFGSVTFEEKEDVYYSFKDATYQNPGMVKNFSYDTLITGSSMTQNFDSYYFDELMGVNSLKASLSGGNARNTASIAKAALEHNNELKRIYVSLDHFGLFGDYLAEGNQSPEYLLNSNVLDDVSYIFNKDFLFTYTLNDLWLKNNYNVKTQAKNEIFMWSGMAYGETKVRQQYARPQKWDGTHAEDFFFSAVENNLNLYWVPLITNNTDVEFDFFVPPYSMLYWDRMSRIGNREAAIAAFKHAAEILMQYDNVKVYYFAGIESIVTNLWNYKDESHYHLNINDFMTECFAEDKYLLTDDNFEQMFTEVSELTENFDYEIYFTNELASVNDFVSYINTIDYDKSAVLLAVSAEHYAQLPEDIQTELIKLGINPLVSEGSQMYLSVKDSTGIRSDMLSEEQKKWTFDLDGRQAIFEEIVAGNESLFSIRIDEVEYSQNSSGISFVIYDLENGRVIDSVAFEGTDIKANRLGIWSDLPKYRKYLRRKVVL